MSKPKILNDLGNTAQLNTTSKEVVGAINEIQGKLPTDTEKQTWNNKAEAGHEHTHLVMKSSNSSIRIGTFYRNHTGVYGGNGDGAVIGTVTDGVSSGKANLILQSWYGVGFANSCPDDGAQGINIAMNVRNGSIETRGSVKSHSDVVASGASLASGLGRRGNYTGNIDELYTAGIYKLANPYSGTMPSSQTISTAEHSVLTVMGDSGSAGGTIVQELFTANKTTYANYANRCYRRTRFGNSWSEWSEIGNRDKVSFVCTASTGHTIEWQHNYIINGIAYYNLTIKKTDNTAFTTDVAHHVATAPNGAWTGNYRTALCFNGLNSNETTINQGLALLENNAKLHATTASPSTVRVHISGAVVL